MSVDNLRWFKTYAMIRNAALALSVVSLVFFPFYLFMVSSISIIGTVMLFDKIQKPGFISLSKDAERFITCKIFVPDARYLVYYHTKFVNTSTIDITISCPTIIIEREFFSLLSKLSIFFVDEQGQTIKTKPIDASWLSLSDIEKLKEMGLNVVIR